MKVDGKSMRSIWLEPDGWSVGVIDQTALPHRLVTARLTTLAEAAHAIRAMVIRGAPLIGAAKIYGEMGDRMVDMSERVGLSVESLSSLTVAANETGVETEALELSIRKMQKTIEAGPTAAPAPAAPAKGPVKK